MTLDHWNNHWLKNSIHCCSRIYYIRVHSNKRHNVFSSQIAKKCLSIRSCPFYCVRFIYYYDVCVEHETLKKVPKTISDSYHKWAGKMVLTSLNLPPEKWKSENGCELDYTFWMKTTTTTTNEREKKDHHRFCPFVFIVFENFRTY